MRFPSRTQWSDVIAKQINAYLRRRGTPTGGKNRRMITVVTTGIRGIPQPKEVFVATSLREDTRMIDQNLRYYLQHSYSTIVFKTENNLALPNIPSDLEILFGEAPYQVDPDLAYGVAGGRACAEPKALQATLTSKYQITGMSTFWWGNSANPHPDPTNNFFALPCDICQSNETYIMMQVMNQKLANRGVNFQMESPI